MTPAAGAGDSSTQRTPKPTTSSSLSTEQRCADVCLVYATTCENAPRGQRLLSGGRQMAESENIVLVTALSILTIYKFD